MDPGVPADVRSRPHASFSLTERAILSCPGLKKLIGFAATRKLIDGDRLVSLLNSWPDME